MIKRNVGFSHVELFHKRQKRFGFSGVGMYVYYDVMLTDLNRPLSSPSFSLVGMPGFVPLPLLCLLVLLCPGKILCGERRWSCGKILFFCYDEQARFACWPAVDTAVKIEQSFTVIPDWIRQFASDALAGVLRGKVTTRTQNQKLWFILYPDSESQDKLFRRRRWQRMGREACMSEE